MKLRRCGKCIQWLPPTEFFKRTRSRDGLAHTCKQCARARVTAWRKNNPERVAESQRRSRYNLSPAEFDGMRAEQNNRCAICLVSFAKTPAVDHDHDTGAVRALLCGACNRALGFVERPEWLHAALAYLGRHKRETV